MCFCAKLPTLDTTTRVVILQHTRERDMPIGTARMASLCLPKAKLHVGVRWGDNVQFAASLGDPAYPPILLYPGPGARDILTEPPPGPVTLVVVDGTWAQAKSVVRDNPILHALPRYAFSAPEPSRYRIRREPRAEYCSTIEALMHVLGVLEGDPERFRSLLVPFEAMIDAQLACEATTQTSRYRQPQPPRVKRPNLPDAIESRWSDLVCVAGAANAWPYQAGATSPPDELIHWVACRPSDGASFEAIAAPTYALSPNTTFHSLLPEARILAGMARAELLAKFAQFVRPTDIICSWGHYPPGLFAEAGGELPAARLDLRVASQRYMNRKIGSIETFGASLGETPGLGDGRGGRRLATLVQLVRSWRALVT